jgi:hypothetical protein
MELKTLLSDFEKENILDAIGSLKDAKISLLRAKCNTDHIDKVLNELYQIKIESKVMCSDRANEASK